MQEVKSLPLWMEEAILYKRAWFCAITLELCIIVALLCCAWFTKTSASADAEIESQVYPAVGKVMRLIPEYDMIMIVTRDGNRWVMQSIDDWMVGDNVCMAMDNSGTPDDVTDDWIIAVRYFA